MGALQLTRKDHAILTVILSLVWEVWELWGAWLAICPQTVIGPAVNKKSTNTSMKVKKDAAYIIWGHFVVFVLCTLWSINHNSKTKTIIITCMKVIFHILWNISLCIKIVWSFEYKNHSLCSHNSDFSNCFAINATSQRLFMLHAVQRKRNTW